MNVEELFGASYVVTWLFEGFAHMLDFDDRDTALSMALMARECGRDNVMVGRGKLPDVPPGAKERVWQGIIARLGEEKTRERMLRREAERERDQWRALVEGPIAEVAS